MSWLDSSQGAVDQKKLETIGELASGVAHDFNNLIMGIQSNAEAMLAQPSLAAAGPRQPGQHHPGLLDRRFADAQSSRLCEAAAADDGAVQPGRPDPRCRAHRRRRLGEISHRAGEGFSGPERRRFPLVGSYSSLSHCLLNLIKNAREAMPDGGTVHVLWEGNETRAALTVRDHGAGISEQDMAHIFEPFFSTKKQGTGLGLAMVRGILTQHSGTVEIRSTVGMGTSVSLIWPRGETEAPKQAQGEGEPGRAPLDAPHFQANPADHSAIETDARRSPFPGLCHR